MKKKLVVIASVFVVVFAMVLPVYAQTPSPAASQGDQSFFGEITSFFGGLFHHQNGQGFNSTQGQSQSGPMEGGEQVHTAPSGTAMMPRPSGQPAYMTMQQYRLDLLVKEGKITQTQEQQILAELTSVQNQLESWAKTNGIDPSYVVGGPMMVEQGQQQGSLNTQQGENEMHPMMRSQGSTSNGGQQSGFQSEQQGGSRGGFEQRPEQQGHPQQ